MKIELSAIPKEILSLWNPEQQQVSFARIPEIINPFADDGVEVFAVIPPLFNIKFLTVLGLLLGAKERGMLDRGANQIVESTSGNTGLWLALLARHFGVTANLIVAHDLPGPKRDALLIAGAKFLEPFDKKSGIATARAMGGGGWISQGWQPDKSGLLNLDQYANPDGFYFHESWLGLKILHALGDFNFFASALGTGGTAIGLSNCFKRHCRDICMVGGLCAPGQEIPGARDERRMGEIKLPWRKTLDTTVEIETRPAYVGAVWLHRAAGIPAGPTAGLAFYALLKVLRNAKQSGLLDSMRKGNGRKVRAAFLVPDASTAYTERFTANILGDWFLELPSFDQLVR